MILLVDDDVCYLRVIPHMLKMQNVKVAAINQISEAQDWLSSGKTCQTIIINLHMRGGEGLQFLNWLENQSPDQPVIILDNPHRHNYQDINHNHDYQKLTIPFNGEDLLKVLANS